MPQVTESLPDENTDPWYTPLSQLVTAIKAAVNTTSGTVEEGRLSEAGLSETIDLALAEEGTVVAAAAAAATAAVAGALADAGVISMTEAVNAFAPRTSGPLKVFDIRDYLDGDPLPNDGEIDASPLLRAVYEIASAWHLSSASTAFRAGGIPVAIYCPDGAYRMTQHITARSGVGVTAAGRDRTVFKPEGQACFIAGTLWNSEPEGGWTFYDDVIFADFTVDCINQFDPAGWNGAVKAFYTQNMRRMRVERVDIYDCYASAFGMDFLTDCQFTDSRVFRAGRSGDNLETLGPTTSGFAPGTGRFDDESALFTNCYAEGCYGAGWLLEQVPGRGATLRSPGFSLVNCRSVRNKFGLSDAGTGGISATGCEFSENTHAGIVVSGSAGREAGRNGRITSSTFYKNGDLAAPGSDGAGGHGVVFIYGENPDGWDIESNLFLGNLGRAVYVSAKCSPLKGGLRIRGGVMRDNAQGVHIGGLVKRLAGLEIEGVLFEGNTQAGIHFDDGLHAPQIIGNTFQGATQPVGIRWSPDRPTTTPIVTGNVFTDQATPMSNTPSASTLIKDNAITQTITAMIRALAGVEPVYVIDGSGLETRNASGLSWDSAVESTTYLARDIDPTGNNIMLLVRDAANQSKISISRQTGNANWLAQIRNPAGGVVSATLAGPIAKAVLCVVRKELEIGLYVNGVGGTTAAILGWPAATIVANVQRSAGNVYAVTFPGAHNEATRNAIMAALAAEYVTV